MASITRAAIVPKKVPAAEVVRQQQARAAELAAVCAPPKDLGSAKAPGVEAAAPSGQSLQESEEGDNGEEEQEGQEGPSGGEEEEEGDQ